MCWCVGVFVCLFVCVFVCLFVGVGVCLFVCLFVGVFVWVFVGWGCLFVCLHTKTRSVCMRSLKAASLPEDGEQEYRCVATWGQLPPKDGRLD